MPADPDKRALRKLKQSIKRRGNKHRRQQLKRTLDESPESAHDAGEFFGRHASAAMNGMDKDSTRRRSDQGN